MRRLVIVSAGDRPEMLQACLVSLARHGLGARWRVSLVLQGDAPAPEDHGLELDVERLSERVGPHSARMHALKTWDAETWCWWDDDMEATELTRYDAAVARAHERGVGLVSTGWWPSEHPSWAKTRPVKDAWVKQPIVYTGGGLVCSRETAGVIERNLGSENLWCDNSAWSLALYLRGMENWRWRGSVAIHRVCRCGGRKRWVKDTPDLLMPNARYLQLRESGRAGELGCIPDSGDLTALAREQHRRMRRASRYDCS